MAITNIEEYLAPLTNNERAVLLHAAGVKYRVARTQSVEQDLSGYIARDVEVSSAQIDRAVAGLVGKGYVTLKPKRGNLTVHRGHHIWPSRTLDGHGMRFGHRAVPFHKVFTEKAAGAWSRTGWSDIADAVPVEDVKTAVREYRQAQAAAEKEKERQAALDAPARTERLEAELEKAARAFIAAREARVPIMEKVDGFYDLHESVGDMQSAMTNLTRWRTTRPGVEERGK